MLNTVAMEIDELDEPLRDYARKLEEDQAIDVTEMFMALGRNMKTHGDVLGELRAYIERPWWKKLLGLPPKVTA